jgi:hypothetical protein
MPGNNVLINMTNAQLAAYFAALPANQTAQILLINIDLAGGALATLSLATPEHAEWCEDLAPNEVLGRVCVTQEQIAD